MQGWTKLPNLTHIRVKLNRRSADLNTLTARQLKSTFGTKRLIDVWINSKICLYMSELILKYLQNLSSSLSKSSRNYETHQNFQA